MRHVRRNLVGKHGKNQCPSCGEFFNSNASFDKHRYGEYSDRRCYTPEEMRSELKMTYHEGWWVIRLATAQDKQKLRSIRNRQPR